MDNELIFIVDRDPHAAANIRALLELNGYGNAVVAEGKYVLELATASRPCLAVIEMDAEDGRGNPVRRLLKTSAATCHIPLIVYSASNSLDDVHRALKEGMESYIRVPYDPVILLQEIGRLLKIHSEDYVRTAVTGQSSVPIMR